MQKVQKYFISLILSYKARKKTALLRCTSSQVDTGHKCWEVKEKEVYGQTDGEDTRTNERIRVLRPKSRILKVPFPFPSFFSVSLSVSGSDSGFVSVSLSVVRGIAPYI